MVGLVLLNKPEGITSFGAVAKIKRLTGEKRVGHTGTLDPMATGVLPILIGRATVLSQYLIDADKGYSATVKLGITTDTCDITGKVLSQNEFDLDDARIDAALDKFVGKQLQTPPMFSAIKQNGVRMYELARKGETVEIPARQIEVFSLSRTSSLKDGQFDVDTLVSKGTYIRSLCRDVGDLLGCGATLTKLTRTSTAGFCIDECVDLNSLTAENIGNYILPADTVVKYMPYVSISEKQAVRFCNGGELDLCRIKYDAFEDEKIYRVYSDGKFLGLGRTDLTQNILKIQCLVAG